MSSDATLTILGFGMVITFMTLIMLKRLSPLVALTLIPLVFAIVGGFGGPALTPMILDGIRTLAPTGVMLTFAILYFGLMIDVGLFDPIVRFILRVVENDPLKVVVGTAILASVVSLDGDGSTTYMVVAASMLPLYRRLGLNVLNLTCVTILAGGVMNLTPWGGPLARAASALQVDPMDVFIPLVPVMGVGIAGVLMLAVFLGLRERRRLGKLNLQQIATSTRITSPATKDTAKTGNLPNASNAASMFLYGLALVAGVAGLVTAVAHAAPAWTNTLEPSWLGAGAFAVALATLSLFVLVRLRKRRHAKTATQPAPALTPSEMDFETSESASARERRHPKLFWFNAALTLALMSLLIIGALPSSVLFMTGFALAMIVNFPRLSDQRERIAAHAQNVLSVVSVIFAAGVFTGVLDGTGMVDAMSKSFLGMLPDQLGPHLAIVTAIASMPFTFFISNDAFYFGVMPIVSEAAGAYGISPVEIARASLIGQPVHLLSPLVPSTYLLVGLAGVEFGDHQRFTIGWAVLLCLLMLGAALLLGLFPLISG